MHALSHTQPHTHTHTHSHTHTRPKDYDKLRCTTRMSSALSNEFASFPPQLFPRCVALCCTVAECCSVFGIEQRVRELPVAAVSEVCCLVVSCSVFQCYTVFGIEQRVRKLPAMAISKVCCSVLQYFAVCCSVFGMQQRVRELPAVAVYMVCCSVLQYVVAFYSILQFLCHCATHSWGSRRGCFYGVLQCVAMCCNVLQCVAVCCSVLQYVSVLRCFRHRATYSRACYLGSRFFGANVGLFWENAGLFWLSAWLFLREYRALSAAAVSMVTLRCICTYTHTYVNSLALFLTRTNTYITEQWVCELPATTVCKVKLLWIHEHICTFASLSATT